MLSRLLGLVRDQTMAALFGAGFASDAFNAAFRIPNLLRDLFAEGAMSAAFIPTFTEAEAKRGANEAWVLGRQVMSSLLLVLLALCVLGWAFSAPFMDLLAGGFAREPGKLDLTAWLFRVMLPFLPLVAMSAVAMGMLNARGVFGVPALAPALLNAGMVVFGLALMPACRAIGQPPIVAMAIGVVLGAGLQFAFQLPSLRRQGFRFALEWPTWPPGVRRIAMLMGPATIGLAATNVNVIVASRIASSFVEGTVTWLYCAFRLMQLPIGVFGVALATVSMPALSRAAVDGDLGALKSTLSAATRLVLVLTIPAAVLLAVLAEPTLAVLFEHGHFHAADTLHTAEALVFYCLGLPAFAAIGVFSRAFYALGDTRLPMFASLAAVTVNLALNLLLVGPLRFLGLDHRGIALAASLAAFANLAQLVYWLRRRIGGFGGRQVLSTLLRVLAAAGFVGGVLALGMHVLGPRWRHGHLTELATVGCGLALGAGLLWLALRAARVEELAVIEGLVRSLRRRFAGGR
ncbi:MAG: murein biosynthesis integral membrane protein MurJ [Candidatus Eisenbacteria bacterium]|nr:murein biosynthesis integral membrane protein MurJ [Candidatus Eisenbacteria bacterium]